MKFSLKDLELLQVTILFAIENFKEEDRKSEFIEQLEYLNNQLKKEIDILTSFRYEYNI